MVGADALCYAAAIRVVCRVSRGPLQRVLSRRSAQCEHAEHCFLCMGALTGSIEAMGGGRIRHKVSAAARRARRLRPASDNVVDRQDGRRRRLVSVYVMCGESVNAGPHPPRGRVVVVLGVSGRKCGGCIKHVRVGVDRVWQVCSCRHRS